MVIPRISPSGAWEGLSCCGMFWKAPPPFASLVGLSTLLVFLLSAYIFISLTQITQFGGSQSPVRPPTDAGMAHGVPTAVGTQAPSCSVPRGGRALGSDRLVPPISPTFDEDAPFNLLLKTMKCHFLVPPSVGYSPHGTECGPPGKSGVWG